MLRNRQAQAEVVRRTEEMAVEGLPYDNATLAVYYREGTSDLRANQWLAVQGALDNPDFAKASEDIPILGSNGADIPPLGQPWPEQSSVQSFVDQHQSILDQLIELASHDDPVQFPIEFDGYMTLLSHVQAMRQCSRLLSVEANLARHAGDREREYRAVNAMFGCALAIRGEPSLIAHLVAIALHGIASGELRSSIEANTFDEQQLQRLADRLNLFDDFRTPTYRSIRGEIAFGLSTFENPDLDEFSASPMVGIPGFVAQDKLNYLELMEQVSDLLSKEDLTLMEYAKGSKEWEEAFNDSFEKASWLKKLESIRTGLVTPAVDAYARAVIRHASENRLAKIGVGLRRYEAKHGELPESLGLLEEFGINVAAEVLPNGEQFGYRKYSPGDELKGIVWGYDMVNQRGSATDPDQVGVEPPTVESINPNGYEGWFWRLK